MKKKPKRVRNHIERIVLSAGLESTLDRECHASTLWMVNSHCYRWAAISQSTYLATEQVLKQADTSYVQ